jgi:threonine synthase
VRSWDAARLRCTRCSSENDPSQWLGLCACGGTLAYEPDLSAARSLDPAALASLGPGPRSLGACLPPQKRFLTLGEGGTPLRRAQRLGRACDLRDLWFKDETVNPTGSFKDRGLALAVGMARAHGMRRLALATAGNAGVSAALYARAAGADLKVVAPRVTPAAYLERARGWGAQVEVNGEDLGEAGAALRGALGREERFDLSTLREPYRVEGKKLIGYEIMLRMRDRPPDWIILPTGGGTAVIGVDKALSEMEALGWLTSPGPRLAAAQAAGCAPVARAFEAGESVARSWDGPRTRAWGLRVPSPLGGERILSAIRRRRGVAVAVPEEEIERGARDVQHLEGIPAGLEAGAGVAAARALLARGALRPEERVVLLITGLPPAGVDSPLSLPSCPESEFR